MDLFRLDGEVALVTGAGSGIGKAIAIGLAQAGADVACFGHTSKSGLEETAQAIAALDRKIAGAGRLGDGGSGYLAEAVRRTENELGPLTVAVNNAGIAGSEPAETLPRDKWERLYYDINVRGVFISCQAEARVMLPRQGLDRQHRLDVGHDRQ